MQYTLESSFVLSTACGSIAFHWCHLVVVHVGSEDAAAFSVVCSQVTQSTLRA
jgi:hypothetical protein